MAYGQQFNNLFSSLTTPLYEQKREIVSVSGIQEAKAYFLNRGENIILRDLNEDIIYVKVCDEAGKCSLKVYSCTDITEKALSEPVNQNVNKSDIDSLKNEISELKKLIKEGANGKYNASKLSKRSESSVSDTELQ